MNNIPEHKVHDFERNNEGRRIFEQLPVIDDPLLVAGKFYYVISDGDDLLYIVKYLRREGNKLIAEIHYKYDPEEPPHEEYGTWRAQNPPRETDFDLDLDEDRRYTFHSPPAPPNPVAENAIGNQTGGRRSRQQQKQKQRRTARRKNWRKRRTCRKQRRF